MRTRATSARPTSPASAGFSSPCSTGRASPRSLRPVADEDELALGLLQPDLGRGRGLAARAVTQEQVVGLPFGRRPVDDVERPVLVDGQVDTLLAGQLLLADELHAARLDSAHLEDHEV